MLGQATPLPQDCSPCDAKYLEALDRANTALFWIAVGTSVTGFGTLLGFVVHATDPRRKIAARQIGRRLGP